MMPDLSPNTQPGVDLRGLTVTLRRATLPNEVGEIIVRHGLASSERE